MLRRTHTGKLAVECVAVLLFYGLVAAWVTWPIAGSLGSRALGVVDGDSSVLIWWFEALQKYGYHVTGTTHLTEIGVPYGSNQANGLNIQWAWPFYPAYLMTKAVGPVVAYNLTLLSGLTLSGATAYALLRRLDVGVLVAGWGGLVYLVFPWHVERAVVGHAQLIHIEGLPLVALALVLLAEKQTRRRVAYLGGAVLLCWLSMGYFGVMAIVMVAAASLAWAVQQPNRRRGLRASAFVTAVSVGIAGLVFLASLAGGGDGGVGARRTPEELTRFGLRPLELVVPTSANPEFRRFVPGFWETRKHGSNIQETSNYVGWVTIGLAGTWALLLYRRRVFGGIGEQITIPALALGGVAFLLALPGSVAVRGHEWKLMPARLLWEVVRPFRVPSRWTAVIMLVLVVLASLALAELVRIARRSAPAHLSAAIGTALVVVAAALSVVELRATHPGVHYDPRVDPPEYGLLASVPAGALAEYPLAAFEASAGSEYLMRQRRHHRPLISVPNPFSNENEGLRRSLVDPEAPGVAAKLAAMGVSAAITRPDTLSRALEAPLPDVAPVPRDGFELVGTTASGASVWRIAAAPAPGLAYAEVDTFTTPYPDSKGRIVQRPEHPKAVIRVVRPKGGRIEGDLHVPVYADGEAPVPFVLGGRRLSATPSGTTVVIPVSTEGDAAVVLTSVDPESPPPVAIGSPWLTASSG
ncbi:MAG: hypothetical protein U0R50_14640 [Gaiellales bacterium]